MSNECLACEIHVLYRVVLRFTKEAVKKGRATRTCAKLNKEFKAYINYKEDTNQSAVARIIIDAKLPNTWRRTVMKTIKEIEKHINASDLDEGFIDAHESTIIQDLIVESRTYTCKR